jgi:plastocyanin/uncharacterized protein YjdB
MPLHRSMVRFALPLALACGGSGGPARAPVASVTLTAASSGPLTSIGDTLLLTAVPRDAAGAAIPGVPIQFLSSIPAAATVTQGGLVTAVANGATTIHASAEGKEATLDVTVAQVIVQVLVTPSSIRVPPSETPIFQASAVDARNHPVGGAPAPVWTTTDATVATIGSDGRATVSATAANGAAVSAVATVGGIASASGGLMTVDSTATYVETINVTPSTATDKTTFSRLNDTSQFSATASNQRLGDVTSSVTFTWSSSAPAVAGVSTSGLATSLANGNASIIATSNGVSGSIGVTVAQVPASVTVSASGGGSLPPIASLGASASLVGTAFDSGGSAIPGATFTWTSDATSIATVSSSGVVTAVNNGTAHVTAHSNQIASPAFTVTVQQVVAIVSVLPATVSIPRCTTQQFSATPRDARGNAIASAPAPSWTSASTTVATVNASSGLATTVSTGGPVAIRATISNVTGSAQLTVNTARITVDWPGNAATKPLVITTCASQTIIWHNADSVNFHSATGTTGPPTTGEIMPGAQSFPQSFPGAGTYSFHCDDHLNETGTVIIQ